MVGRRVDHLPLPGGAPAPKKGGSLPPPSPPPVRRHEVPCEAGTRSAGAARDFTPEDSGNPCQPASNADFREQPGPQRRGLRPLREERWGCQKRAPPDGPPDGPPPPFSVAHEYDGTTLTPGDGNYRSILLRSRPSWRSTVSQSVSAMACRRTAAVLAAPGSRLSTPGVDPRFRPNPFPTGGVFQLQEKLLRF